MNLIEIFNNVRDIPYELPTNINNKNNSCLGKHRKLKSLLEKEGIKARYKICSYLWNSMNLPENVLSLIENDEATHLYLEILINKKWIILDATWDSNLKNIFEVNFWDGKSDTMIAVKPVKIFSVEESEKIIGDISAQDVLNNLGKDLDFKSTFNNWLSENRIK